MTAKILQWKGKVKAPEFEDFNVLVNCPLGGPNKEMVLKVNPCIQNIDSGSIPIVYLNNINITDEIIGVVSCSINQHSLDDVWVDCAYILTVEGKVFARGRDQLPLWHLQSAADLNCKIVTEPIKESARNCMEKLKEYCEYVYQSQPKAYDFNAGLIV